jgi:glycerol-3-phosphate dehydrogenase
VVELGEENKMLNRVHPDYPFCEAEILYAIRSELAQKPNDIACRRVPIAFVNQHVTAEVFLPRVVEIM